MGKLLIDLNTFKVIKKTDVLKEEPYLWLFGLAIEAGVRFKQRSDALHYQAPGCARQPGRAVQKRRVAHHCRQRRTNR